MNSREEFIEFVMELRISLKEEPEKWENKTLDSFLEAIARYTEDIQGYYSNTNQPINADDANWKIFSDILKGASII